MKDIRLPGEYEYDLSVEIIDTTPELSFVKFTMQSTKGDFKRVVSHEIIRHDTDVTARISEIVGKLQKMLSGISDNKESTNYDYSDDPTDCRIIPFPSNRKPKN